MGRQTPATARPATCSRATGASRHPRRCQDAPGLPLGSAPASNLIGGHVRTFQSRTFKTRGPVRDPKVLPRGVAASSSPRIRRVQVQWELLADRGATVTREACKEPWRLLDGWIQDPEGTRIVLLQVPDEHPIRRDLRQR